MNIEDFWNKAFLASLCRVDVVKAKSQADEATKLCIEHWNTHHCTWVHYSAHWKDQPISSPEASNPIR